MANIINSIITSNFFIIFSILFNSVTLDIKIQDILLNNTNIEIKYSESSFFHIIINFELSLFNNVKIKIEGNDANKNYIISYYKNDSSFRNREQLSQSNDGKSFMWLNKKQITDNFYLSVECFDSPC